MEKTDNFSVADLIAGVLLIVAGSAIIHASLQMKVFKTFLDAPGFFPFLLGIVFNVLGLMMTVSAINRKGHVNIFKVFSGERIKAAAGSIESRRVMALMALMVVYIFGLIGRVHFTLATFLYLFFTFLFLRSASLVKNLVISLLVSILVSAVFTEFFHIPLPH